MKFKRLSAVIASLGIDGDYDSGFTNHQGRRGIERFRH